MTQKTHAPSLTGYAKRVLPFLVVIVLATLATTYINTG